MADDQLQLLASKSDYEQLISDIDAQLQVLNGIADEYEALKNNVSMFMAEEDDNFENMKANAQENVKAVHEAIGMATITKRQLQATVDEMDELGSNITQTLTSGAEAIGSGVKAAIHASDLL